MLRHDHVSDNNELIALAHLFEHGEKQVAMFLCSEEGTALITTAGDKVQVSGAVKTLGLAVHVARVEGRECGCGDGTHRSAVTKAGGESGKPPSRKAREGGHPPAVFRL